MRRFFREYWVILLGLLLAFYGAGNAAAALQLSAGIAVEEALEQAEAAPARARPAEPGAALRLRDESASRPPARPATPEIRDTTPERRDRMSARTARAHPPPEPEIPLRLVIPYIGLDAPVLPAEAQAVRLYGQEYRQWRAPDRFAAGWHGDSARLGETGNTVLNGHNNVYGEVFRELIGLPVGEEILVYGQETLYRYRVTNVEILPEKNRPLKARLENARWMLPSVDERLTLVTCWPYESNTHRLIVVAEPLSRQELARKLQ